MRLPELLRKAVDNGRDLTRPELRRLLELTDPADAQQLFEAAYEVKRREVGCLVHLRGLIEIGNLCSKNCYYCGIRRGNRRLKRFQLALPEIVEMAREADEFRYGSVVLQGGERSDAAFVDFITGAVEAIKRISGGRLGITLSLGEQSLEVYRRWFAAGAHRYLLRLEASNPELYRRLHPADHSYDRRLACLGLLRQAGYQVGSGVMIGLPTQTTDDLVDDLEFFRRTDLDMIGMGPYLPHDQAPLTAAYPEVGNDRGKQLQAGLKMIAVTRLYLRDVNIASTTALQALAPNGRELGLLAGGNVIMPNVTATRYRASYQLYNGKPGIDENSSESREKLEKSVASVGEAIDYGQWGDSPHFARRNRRN